MSYRRITDHVARHLSRNRTELNLKTSSEEVARRLGVRADDAKAIIQCFLDVVTETLAEGVAASFRNFGTFVPTRRYDPRAGKRPDGPTGVGFRAADHLKHVMTKRNSRS